MATKKPLTQESIALFKECGLTEAQYSLLSNSLARDAQSVPAGVARKAYVLDKLSKAQERANASAEYFERRNTFGVVELPAKEGMPKMYAVNGLKNGRVLVTAEGWDFLMSKSEIITKAIKG